MKKALLAFASLALIGCMHLNSGQQITIGQQQTNLGHFTEITVVDGASVTVRSGRPSMRVLTDSVSAPVASSLHAGQLLISGGENTRVVVHTPSLKTLRVDDHATVRLHRGRHHSATKVTITDHGHVILSGNVDDTEVTVKQQGKLAGNRLSGDHLTLRLSQQGQAVLAGRIQWLNAKLNDRSRLFAERLHAKRVGVSAHQRSVARVAPQVKLQAMASEQSRVLYFSQPAEKSVHATYNGAVLNATKVKQRRIS